MLHTKRLFLHLSIESRIYQLGKSLVLQKHNNMLACIKDSLVLAYSSRRSPYLYLESLPRFQSLPLALCIAFSGKEALIQSSTGDDGIFRDHRASSLMSARQEDTFKKKLRGLIPRKEHTIFLFFFFFEQLHTIFCL